MAARLVLFAALCHVAWLLRGGLSRADHVDAAANTVEAYWSALRSEYHEYLEKFGKPHIRAEDVKRLMRYARSKLLIEAHNVQVRAYNLSLNHFADLLEDELREIFGRASLSPTYAPTQLPSRRTQSVSHVGSTQPTDAISLNWASRDNPYHMPLLRDVNSQGSCGACWAFVTAAATEAAVKQAALAQPQADPAGLDIAVPPLSAQELLDCDRDFNNGCDGGNLFRAMDFVVDHGLVSALSYPYQEKMEQCRGDDQNMTRYFMKRPIALPIEDETAILRALQRGPVAVGVCGTEDAFLLYAGGIFDRTSCCSTLNHAMLLVGSGYDAVRDLHYWVALNSWGWYWGERGYMRILRRRGAHAGSLSLDSDHAWAPPAEGMCGLYLSPVQAGAGYVLRADGALAFTGDPSRWDAYWLQLYRLLHRTQEQWRTVAMLAAGACLALSLCVFVYATYLDLAARAQPPARRRPSPNQSDYQPIPDMDMVCTAALPA